MSIREDLERINAAIFEHLSPQHDLAGLDAFMALVLPLESCLETLAAYQRRNADKLRASEQEGLRATIRSLTITITTLHER